jgi:hypothetical protein
VKAIGALEVLAAIGLVLPAVTGVAPVLVPLAGLGLLMIGARVVHVRRGEASFIVVNAALLAAAVFVTWGRELRTTAGARSSFGPAHPGGTSGSYPGVSGVLAGRAGAPWTSAARFAAVEGALRWHRP